MSVNVTPFLYLLYNVVFLFLTFCFKKESDQLLINYPPIFLSYFQEAMAKDTMELNTEPDLNIKAFLADAYLHPIFHSFEEEEMVEVQVDKYQAQAESPVRSELSSPSSDNAGHHQPPSPPHYVYDPHSSPTHYIYNPPSPPRYVYNPPSPPHYAYYN